MTTRVLVVAVAVLAAACAGPAGPSSSSPDPSVAAGGGSCADEAWGGWTGNAECAAAAERVVAGADRTCRDDTDCVWIGSPCGAHALAATSRDTYRSWPGPCDDPASGQCRGPCGATCVNGCCERDYDQANCADLNPD